MLTITLPDELEKTITERAKRSGMTPEVFVIDDLQERYLPPRQPDTAPVPEQTMADFLKDYIGCIDSGETYPQGSRLSENTGRAFAALMIEKRNQGKL